MRELPLAAEALAKIRSQAVTWIEDERRLHRAHGRPLNDFELLVLAPFFPGAVLRKARVTMVHCLKNPTFTSVLERAPDGGLLFDLTSASAIAFVDTVLVVRSVASPDSDSWSSLLFHELVHLTQYRVLGREGFVDSYMRSMIEEGFAYRAIAHEAQAFALQGKFEEDPGRPFSVEREVRTLFRDELSR